MSDDKSMSGEGVVSKVIYPGTSGLPVNVPCPLSSATVALGATKLTVLITQECHSLIQKADPNDLWLTTPGTWRRVQLADGRRNAHLSCPKCGRSVSLSGHTVAVDGTVTPSLVCPYAGCPFHEYVRLDGWAKEVRDG